VDLFEYQAKVLLGDVGVPVPEGRLARTPDQARQAASELGGTVVVKAQVQAGGRGKAGGIKAVARPAQAEAAASEILGMNIGGHTVGSVLVERAVAIGEEYYACFTLDRAARQHLAMVSARGGIDIETVAAQTPEAVVKMRVNPVAGLASWQANELVHRAGLDRSAARQAAAVLLQLYRAYVDLDADLIEVNPLVLTAGGDVVAVDAKVTLDESAFFRHPQFPGLRTALSEDPMERAARDRGLSFVRLNGSVGIIGNGAGLVMSTIDVVSLVGGAAANFLDVGGGAGPGTISGAIEILARDETVRAVLVNVFGGITRCDLVAEGIVNALGDEEPPWPVVVRLDGTNAEEGRAVLAGVPSDRLETASSMLEAARRAVELAGGS
jgi:succinyl-CoA synthetase beta subunit